MYFSTILITKKPYLDIDPGKELLAPHVPDSLVGQGLQLGAAAVLQLRWRQYSTTNLQYCTVLSATLIII